MSADVPLREAIAGAVTRLAAAGVPSPEHDAWALAAHVLGVSPAALVTHDTIDEQPFDALVERRSRREPLQHLLGTVGFRHLELAVGPGVFIPRPETELVAAAAIEAACNSRPRPLVVDLCTGSGAIALSIAQEVAGSRVHAVEVDPAAHAYAERNIAETGYAVRLHLDDAATALAEYDGRVDVVVSNPPYVPDDERPVVDPEVRRDPERAVWGGADGLDVIRVVIASAARLLRLDGVLVLEHSDRHGEAVPALLHAQGGWVDIGDHADLLRRPRFVTARRSV